MVAESSRAIAKDRRRYLAHTGASGDKWQSPVPLGADPARDVRYGRAEPGANSRRRVHDGASDADEDQRLSIVSTSASSTSDASPSRRDDYARFICATGYPAQPSEDCLSSPLAVATASSRNSLLTFRGRANRLRDTADIRRPCALR